MLIPNGSYLVTPDGPTHISNIREGTIVYGFNKLHYAIELMPVISITKLSVEEVPVVCSKKSIFRIHPSVFVLDSKEVYRDIGSIAIGDSLLYVYGFPMKKSAFNKHARDKRTQHFLGKLDTLGRKTSMRIREKYPHHFSKVLRNTFLVPEKLRVTSVTIDSISKERKIIYSVVLYNQFPLIVDGLVIL